MIDDMSITGEVGRALLYWIATPMDSPFDEK